jgi:hypothetical protein
VPGATNELLLERHAIQELHHDAGATVVLINVIHRADVGMIERGSGLRLAAKAAESLRVAGDLVGEELQSDRSVQSGIFALVDHAHSARAHLFKNAIVRFGVSHRLNWRQSGRLGAAKQRRFQAR